MNTKPSIDFQLLGDIVKDSSEVEGIVLGYRLGESQVQSIIWQYPEDMFLVLRNREVSSYE